MCLRTDRVRTAVVVSEMSETGPDEIAGGKHNATLGRLHELAAPLVESLGLELVELEMKGSGRRRMVRLFIDRVGTAGVNHEDCKQVSNGFGAVLDEADLFEDSYRLEVSSPGADRPIRTDDDFRRNVGRRVCLVTDEPIDGRNEFRGELVGFEDGIVRLSEGVEGGRAIAVGSIREAHQDVDS